MFRLTHLALARISGLSCRHRNGGGSVVERSMAHVYVDPIDEN
jgi:hypothetical protein